MQDIDTAAMELGAKFNALGDLALARHAARHAAQPQRPAAMYLRVALICVRELAHYSRYDPALCRTAQDLLARITTAAHDAEAACFAAGGNSAPYIAVLALTAGWRVKLREIADDPALAPRRPHPRIPFDAPVPSAVAHPLPRHFVPHDQGGHERHSGHATGHAR